MYVVYCMCLLVIDGTEVDIFPHLWQFFFFFSLEFGWLFAFLRCVQGLLKYELFILFFFYFFIPFQFAGREEKARASMVLKGETIKTLSPSRWSGDKRKKKEKLIHFVSLTEWIVWTIQRIRMYKVEATKRTENVYTVTKSFTCYSIALLSLFASVFFES